MTDDLDRHVPERPNLRPGPTVEDAAALASTLTHVDLPDAADLPTDVADGDPSEEEVQP